MAYGKARSLLGINARQWKAVCNQRPELLCEVKSAMLEAKEREEGISEEVWERFLVRVREHGNVVKARGELGIVAGKMQRYLNGSVEAVEGLESARTEWSQRLGGKAGEVIEKTLDGALDGSVEIGPKVLDTAYKVMARQDQPRWQESKEVNVEIRDYGISLDDARRVLEGARARMLTGASVEVIDVEEVVDENDF